MATLLVLLGLAVAVQTGVYLARDAQIQPEPDDRTSAASESASLSPGSWDAFSVSNGSSSGAAHASQILRYVGPFFRLAGEGTNEVEVRSAVVELIAGGKQDFVQIGDYFESYEITRIDPESITVRQGGVDYELHLSFTNVMASAGAAEQASTPSEEDQPALEVNRFGKRIGEHRWVIQRQAILDYYQELSDDPERLVAVFDSLEPDYSEEGKIRGYQLVTKGEADFFSAVGLQEKDFVRKVNSMNMSSRKRAEYFIGEFLKDRLGGVVIDIERNGKPEKLIYFIR